MADSRLYLHLLSRFGLVPALTGEGKPLPPEIPGLDPLARHIREKLP